MTDGWADSAAAWIADMGEFGDYSRRFVLDQAMLDRIRDRGFRSALDVGCGEGRFSRILQTHGMRVIGIDPTDAFLLQARRMDPQGDYRHGRAECLAFPDGSFDLVVSYLTLIDITDAGHAIAEMARVLCPGGSLLIANLNSFSTASLPAVRTPRGTMAPPFVIDHYLEERAEWVGWRGIRIRNWHRPLSTYMSLLLGQGLLLRHFAEPEPQGGDPAMAERYRRVPYFLVMEWQKPEP
jgi:SAM-dependent methyltransferase